MKKSKIYAKKQNFLLLQSNICKNKYTHKQKSKTTQSHKIFDKKNKQNKTNSPQKQKTFLFETNNFWKKTFFCLCSLMRFLPCKFAKLLNCDKDFCWLVKIWFLFSVWLFWKLWLSFLHVLSFIKRQVAKKWTKMAKHKIAKKVLLCSKTLGLVKNSKYLLSKKTKKAKQRQRANIAIKMEKSKIFALFVFAKFFKLFLSFSIDSLFEFFTTGFFLKKNLAKKLVFFWLPLTKFCFFWMFLLTSNFSIKYRYATKQAIKHKTQSKFPSKKIWVWKLQKLMSMCQR